MVESVFSMKMAVATTSETIGTFMASGLADMRWRCAPSIWRRFAQRRAISPAIASEELSGA